MIYRTLTITTALLAVWITYSIHQNQQAITLLEQNALQAQQQNTVFQTAVMKDYAGIIEFIQKQNAAEKQANQANGKINHQKQLTDLYQAYAAVLEAELLRKNASLPEAVEKLKSSKEIIWKSGDRFANHKEALQSLMQPIDETSAKWQAGDAEATSKPIADAIKQILEALVKG